MNIQKRTREQIVAKVAQDIPTGSFVNLGIGLPTRVAGYLKPEQGVILHSENGVLGFAALNDPEQADDDLINAGKELVSMLQGGSFMNSADSSISCGAGIWISVSWVLFRLLLMVIWRTGIPVMLMLYLL